MLLGEEDGVVLDERDFGMPGLIARECLGPFVPLQASGPIITVHDSVIEPHMGIGHHPHRMNERLFYILSGTLDHDDALNNITGHMGTEDLGRLTEGRTGMYHKEWNNSDDPCRAFILVYQTDPVPLHASFAALRDAEAPRSDEAPGVRTKELIGPASPLVIHGDLRRYTDSTFESGGRLEVAIGADEAGMLVPLSGSFVVEDAKLEEGQTLIAPPGERRVTVEATSPGRLLRIVHGAGDGLVFGEPYARRDQR
jgi:redox-sensitive bicupin YhaK (pirin superfamily)